MRQRPGAFFDIGLLWNCSVVEVSWEAEWGQQHIIELLTSKFLLKEWKPPVALGSDEPEEQMTSPPQPRLTVLAWCNKSKAKNGLASVRTPEKVLRQWYDHAEHGPAFKKFLDEARDKYALDLPVSTGSTSGSGAGQGQKRSQGGHDESSAKKVKTGMSSDMPDGSLVKLEEVPTPISWDATVPGSKSIHVIIVVGQKICFKNTGNSPQLLKKGSIVAGFQAGKFWVKKPSGEQQPSQKDVLFQLTDCDEGILLGSAYQTVGSVIATKRQASPADAHIAYHELQESPTAENPTHFKLCMKHECYFRVEDLKIKGEADPNKEQNIPANHIAGAIPADSWNTWATKVGWLTRWPPTASKGLQPVRPVILMSRDLLIPESSTVKLFQEDGNMKQE